MHDLVSGKEIGNFKWTPFAAQLNGARFGVAFVDIIEVYRSFERCVNDMPTSPDRLPLVPPALRRLNSDTTWDVPEMSQDAQDVVSDCCESTGPNLCTAALHRRLTGGSTEYIMPSTSRAAKSTIHGVVNQFSQLHHRKSTVGRLISSIGNLMRRICNHEARNMRLLDNYQSVEFEQLSDCSQEETAQSSSNKTLVGSQSPSEVRAGSARDREDSPVFMMLTFKDIDPRKSSRKLHKPRGYDGNPKRKRWTSTSLKQRMDVRCGRERISRSIHPLQSTTRPRRSSPIKPARLKDEKSGNANYQSSSLRNTTASKVFTPKDPQKNGRFSSNLSKFFRRPRKLSDANVGKANRPDIVVSALRADSTDDDSSIVWELEEMNIKNKERESSVSSLDVEVETDMETVWTPRCLRRRSSSYDLMDLPDEPQACSSSGLALGVDTTKHMPIRVSSSASIKSTTGSSHISLAAESFNLSPSKSDSLLIGECHRDVDDINNLNLVACGHLTASRDDLVSALEMLVVQDES